MRPKDIEELLDRNPFLPFRISLTSGEHVDVTTRHSVAVGRGQLFIVLPDDRWKLVPLQQIASVETLQAA
jgi:hypothetical protein